MFEELANTTILVSKLLQKDKTLKFFIILKEFIEINCTLLEWVGLNKPITEGFFKYPS